MATYRTTISLRYRYPLRTPFPDVWASPLMTASNEDNAKDLKCMLSAWWKWMCKELTSGFEGAPCRNAKWQKDLYPSVLQSRNDEGDRLMITRIGRYWRRQILDNMMLWCGWSNREVIDLDRVTGEGMGISWGDGNWATAPSGRESAVADLDMRLCSRLWLDYVFEGARRSTKTWVMTTKLLLWLLEAIGWSWGKGREFNGVLSAFEVRTDDMIPEDECWQNTVAMMYD